MRLAAVLAAAVAVPLPAAAAGATRVLKAELTPAPGQPFGVENLAGHMRVVAGSSDRVEATATVHGESEELAGSVRFERVTDEKGRPVLRVRYPLDRHRTFRYPDAPGGGRPWSWWFPGGRSGTRYDGRDGVHVSAREGVLLYADVEVRLPRRALEASFRNVVGPLEGSGVEGRLRFDTASGDISLREAAGEVVADSGSGDVRAQGLSGRYTCDTGSGRCEVSSFQGDSLSCDTGSGEIEVRGARAARIVLDTGSGDIVLAESEADEVSADTGSGSVELQAGGKGLLRVRADTGSGDVRLRLGPDADFEARADMGSGEIVSRYPDATPILRKREVVGYRRGSGRTRITVDTGSGDLILEPGR